MPATTAEQRRAREVRDVPPRGIARGPKLGAKRFDAPRTNRLDRRTLHTLVGPQIEVNVCDWSGEQRRATGNAHALSSSSRRWYVGPHRIEAAERSTLTSERPFASSAAARGKK
jgi:hypothetical protein